MEILGVRKESYQNQHYPRKLYESKSPVKKEFSDDSIEETDIKDSDLVVDDDVLPLPISDIVNSDSKLNKSPTAN